MRVRPEWILLAMLCALDHVTGRLHKPLNLTMESRNFCLILKWEPAFKNPSNVTYDVQYMWVANKRWKSIPGCREISNTECDLTNVLKQNYPHQHDFRVRAVYEKQHSPWTNLSNKDYMSEVHPAAPLLHIIQDDSSIRINMTQQEPSCIPEGLMNLITYWLEFNSTSNPHQKIPPRNLNGPLATVDTLQYKGEVCMAAWTEFIKKKSDPSNMVCLQFTQQGSINYVKFVPGFFSCLAGIFLLFFIYILYYATTQKAKIPKSLEFSNNRRPPPVLEITRELHDSLTAIENIEAASSKTDLLSKTDIFYPSNHCGYAARQPLKGVRLGGSSHTGGSSSDEYTSSNSNKTSSDSSAVQTSGSSADMTLDNIETSGSSAEMTLGNIETSGSSAEMTLGNIETSGASTDMTLDNIQASGSSAEMMLTLDNVQVNNQGDINTNTSGDTEMLGPNISMCPLLDTLHGANTIGLWNVNLNSLSISTGTEHLEYSDNDSEDDQEQLSSNSTNGSASDSYTKPMLKQSPRNCSSGYEHRGYRSRRC